MFLKKTMDRDPELIDTAVRMHQEGLILPDTFVVDVDQFCENAKMILEEAKQDHIELYFMLKQIGRNPYLARKLEEIGYPGAVAVDWKEAQVMMDNGIHLSHVGHLVQLPEHMIEKVLKYGVDYVTVYSTEKLREINVAAEHLGMIQKIMVRVTGKNDRIYSGQTAGFQLEDLVDLVRISKDLKHIRLAGVDSFPCFLYDEETGKVEKQENLNTVLQAKKILTDLGITVENVNAPSTTSVETLKMMKDYPITSGEPGHGLTGTTPLHAHQDCAEVPCVVYLSEISHNFEGHAYAFGGGYYRRGHIKEALIGKDPQHMENAGVILPNMDSIDYHFEMDREFEVASSVIMAFRFQVFVTRSDVCLVEGIHSGNPHIVGLYDSLGRIRI